jgi:hypothetical protein
VGLILIIPALALFLCQLAAFQEGMEIWMGLHWLISSLLAFVALVLPFGTLVTAAVAFYGMTAGWRWAWWQAFLLLFPYAAIAIFLGATEGILGMVNRMKS